MARAKVDIAQQEQEILAALNIFAEYQALGVRLAGEPRNEKCACFAIDREETKPSAVIFAHSGRYVDKGGSGGNFSLWDFAALHGGHATWQEARAFYAAKVGIKIGGEKKPKKNPLDQLEFLPWHAGHDTLAELWCRKHKKGATLEAIKLAGGRIAQFPCWIDKKTNERKKGEFKVIALPCWGDRLLDADPVAWVIWNISGHPLPVYNGKDVPATSAKMLSIGPTAGAMMNFHGISALTDPELSASVEVVWKCAGPSDLLGIQAAILRDAPDLLQKHIVVTNASGETGNILPHQSAMFAGHKVLLVHDADEAGEMGTVKWQVALAPVASELRAIKLPYQVQKKHGKDARDFLNGVPAELMPELVTARG